MKNVDRIVMDGYYLIDDGSNELYKHSNETLELYEKGIVMFFDEYDIDTHTFDGVIFDKSGKPQIEIYVEDSGDVLYIDM